MKVDPNKRFFKDKDGNIWSAYQVTKCDEVSGAPDGQVTIRVVIPDLLGDKPLLLLMHPMLASEMAKAVLAYL